MVNGDFELMIFLPSSLSALVFYNAGCLDGDEVTHCGFASYSSSMLVLFGHLQMCNSAHSQVRLFLVRIT